MAFYRTRTKPAGPNEPGLFELDTPAGPLALPTTEEELRANGHVPDHLSMVGADSGATALNDVPQGRRNVTRADIDRAATTRAADAAAQAEKEKALAALPQPPAGGRRNVTAADIKQAEVAREARAAVEAPPKAEPEGGGKGLRGGGEIVDDSKFRQPRGGEASGGGHDGGPVRVGPAGFVPVSRTVKPGVEGLEDSIDTQNLQRQAQYRIERDAIPEQQARTERTSGELGRNIRAEETALQEERARRARINADLEERQGAIDTERQAIENLEVRPRDIFHGKGTLASALAAITMIGGAIGQPYKGGPNLATEALTKAVDDEIADQKDAELRREKGLKVRQTELGRLTDLYGSPEAAEQEFRIRAHTLIQRKAEKDALDAGATDALANLQARWAKDNVAFEQQKLQLRGSLGDQVSQQERFSSGLVGTGGRPEQKDVHQLASEWNSNKLTEVDAAIGAWEDLYHSLPEGDLPTKASRNIVSRKARDALDYIGGEGTGASAFDSPAEAAATEKLERQLNEAKSKELGAARSDAELADFGRANALIRTRGGIGERINELKRERERRASVVRAGHKPQTVRAFEAERKGYNVPDQSAGLRGER